MKIARSENRRDFNIEPAGYFNVLRPGERFIPSHLHRVFRYLARRTKASTADHAGSQETPDFLIRQPAADAPHIMRWILIVLAAIAITLGWLYGSAVPWRDLGPWPHR